MAKTTDLQPWLDYFGMLRTYEQKGLLEVSPDKHEAYITQPALHALSYGDDPMRQLMGGALLDTARHIHLFAAWKSQEGEDYLMRPFALHVVKDELPHDLLYTILRTRRRGLLREEYKMEVIDYNGK